AVRGKMRRLAVQVERRLVFVLLVEEEEVRILRRAMRPVGETAGLVLAHDAGLLGQQRGQGVALALRRPDLRHHGEHVGHIVLLSGAPWYRTGHPFTSEDHHMSQRAASILALLTAVLMALTLPPASAQEKPRMGGELIFEVAAEPPSFDAHQE